MVGVPHRTLLPALPTGWSGHRRYRRKCGPYLTESVYKVVFKKSIPAQIRELIIYVSNNKGYVDEFVLELTFSTRLHEHLL